MASWVITGSWTQCGQPQSTAPGRIASTSACCGLGRSTTSESARISARLANPPTRAGQLLVAAPEAVPVAVLEGDPTAELGRDPGEVVGVDRETVLVLLQGGADDAETQERRAQRFLPCGSFRTEVSSAWPRFAARFSLIDLPVFLVMLCRGDLSLMGDPLVGSLNGSVPMTVRPCLTEWTSTGR